MCSALEVGGYQLEAINSVVRKVTDLSPEHSNWGMNIFISPEHRCEGSVFLGADLNKIKITTEDVSGLFVTFIR